MVEEDEGLEIKCAFRTNVLNERFQYVIVLRIWRNVLTLTLSIVKARDQNLSPPPRLVQKGIV